LKRAFTKAKHSNRKSGSVGAIFCLDLDGFKQINDHYGHLFGDKLLVSVAERLKSNCRRGDLVARFGGDEFVILSEETKANNLEKIAKHLLAALNQNHIIEGKSLSVSASIGVTVIDTDIACLDQAMEAADKAMYEVKKSGKGRYAIATDYASFAKEGNID
jgi:diguanylate cyclase (GGDEF)-like protein